MKAIAAGNPSAAPEAGPRRDGSFTRVNYRTLRRLGAAQGGGLFVALFVLGTYFTFASEAFLTNSLLEVLPVTRLQDRTLPEGSVTANLARLYRESVARP